MRSVKSTLLLAFSLFAGKYFRVDSFTCGRHENSSDSPRYPFDGDPYPGQFPWFGTVYHRKQNGTVEYACGATLISEKHVLSAIVCARSGETGFLLDSRDVIVRMGKHEKELGEKMSRSEKNYDTADAQYHDVLRIHQPMDYDKTSKNELVILELSDILKFNKYVQPICIQVNDYLVRPDTVIGWRAVNGGIELDEFQKNTEICSNRITHTYYNQAKICNEDRGSIAMSAYSLHKWHIEGIIDCTSSSFVPCKIEPNFRTVALIQFNVYKSWLITVTNLTYLQNQTGNNQGSKIEKYTQSTKFKFQCGKRTVDHPEEDIKKHQLDPYPGQWPWYGLIYHLKPTKTLEYACGGTLISEKHVLTSRICITNGTNQSLLHSRNVLVRFGTHKENYFNMGFAQHRHVSKIHQPKDYNKTSENKLVILELREDVKFNDYVQPICLGQRDYYVEGGVLIGWGATERNGNLGQFKKNVKRCPDEQNSWYYKTTDICSTDRGSIILTHFYDGWYLDTFIDCTKSLFDLCEESETFFKANFIQNYYTSWIIHVTNLDYLQIIRKGQNVDPSKHYNDTLPRLNCGLTLAKHIKGDPNARLYKHPWIVRIFIYSNHINKYTGTLISHRYVLTASEVFNMIGIYNEKNLFVRLGENKYNQDCISKKDSNCILPARDYDVEYVVLHQNYETFSRDFSPYNIALVRTVKVVLFENHINPVCLPVTEDLQQLRLSKYVIASWQHMQEKSLVFQAKQVHEGNCSESRFDFNESMQLCTDTFDSYYSTLGAPLGQHVRFFGKRFVLFGINENVAPNCVSKVSNLVYVKVAYFMDWIIANMEGEF